MPSKGTTPRAIRISDGLWEQVKDAAKAYGKTPSDIVREALTQWLDNPNEFFDNPYDRPEGTLR